MGNGNWDFNALHHVLEIIIMFGVFPLVHSLYESRLLYQEIVGQDVGVLWGQLVRL